MEDVGIFYGHLVYFTASWYILWTYGTICGHLVYFSLFGMLYREESGNPGSETCWLMSFFTLTNEAFNRFLLRCN
jgi:hypothetical protein